METLTETRIRAAVAGLTAAGLTEAEATELLWNCGDLPAGLAAAEALLAA